MLSLMMEVKFSELQTFTWPIQGNFGVSNGKIFVCRHLSLSFANMFKLVMENGVHSTHNILIISILNKA